MSSTVETFSTIFLGIFVEALPFLLIGVLASALMQVFVSDAWLTRLLPRQVVPAAVVGGLLGLIFPVCDCGAIPVSRRLLIKGASLPTALAFMMAGPVINPVVLVSTWVAFGAAPAVVLGRFALVLGVAVAAALVFSRHSEPATLLVPRATPDHGSDDHPPPAGGDRLEALLRHTTAEFFEMGRYLVLGALLGAFLQTILPRSVLLAVGHDPALSVIAAMSLAALLSVCSTVDAFVALSLTTTFSTGAILAFLAFGPIVDLKSVLMYTTTLRRSALVLLVVVTAQLVFLVGATLNLNFG